MKTEIKKMKTELKALAQQIKEKRKTFKQSQRTGDWKGIWNNDPAGDAWTFRHKHIAYCLLRGRTMEQIERSCKSGNEPSMKHVEKYMNEVKDEALRNSERGSIEVAASSASGSCDGAVPTVGTNEQAAPALEQPDTCLPESKGLSFFDRFKSLFG